ncbi:MAG: hypothetical protein KAI47_08270 [Deltaproteobacteria bacterium]|nr:hypothetical protein [Deltaproteobacteria bacterium]
MRRHGLLFVALLLALSGCKHKATPKAPGGKGSSLPAAGQTAAGQAVAPPKALIASFVLRAPGKTLDEALSLAGRFVNLPLTKQGLLDLLLQRAHLPRELLSAFNLEGNFWLLRFDDKALGEKDPMLVLFPLRTAAAFKKILSSRMDDKGADGPLHIYRPKPGQVGLTETRIWMNAHWVVVPTTRKVFTQAKPYLEAVLMQQTPAHDVELTLLMKNLLRGVGAKLDRSLDTAMANLKQRAARRATGRPGGQAQDSAGAANALERTARRYYALAKSAQALHISADVDGSLVRVRLAAEDTTGGKLAKLIKIQRPARPFAHALFPATTWALFANHGRALVADETSPLDVAIQALAGAMPSPSREQFKAAVQNARKYYEDDMTVGLYKPPTGRGVTLAFLARVSKGDAAHQATAQIAKVVATWMEAEAKKAGTAGAMASLAPTSRAFAQGKAKGRIYELTLPADTMKSRQTVDALFGPKVVAGWLFVDNLAALVVGKDAEARMKAIAEAGAKGRATPSLAEAPPFKAAITDGGFEQVGLLYVSLVDLVLGLDGLGIDAIKPFAADLAGKKSQRAPTLAWGVDGKRRSFIVELTLPAEHFLHFKGFLSALRGR